MGRQRLTFIQNCGQRNNFTFYFMTLLLWSIQIYSCILYIFSFILDLLLIEMTMELKKKGASKAN